jgi:hypothetical protein
MKNIKATLTGKGISEIFGGFPEDLEIGKEYELKWDFEIKEYVVINKYKALSFEWNKKF